MGVQPMSGVSVPRHTGTPHRMRLFSGERRMRTLVGVWGEVRRGSRQSPEGSWLHPRKPHKRVMHFLVPQSCRSDSNDKAPNPRSAPVS